jgi:glycosyltransferase involved in cell wall biosynthesis
MLFGIDASRAAYAQRTGTENYSLFLIRALLEQDQQNSYRLYFSQPPGEGLFAPRPSLQMRVIPFPRLWTHLRLSWEMLTAPPDVLFVPAHVLSLWHPRRCLVTVHDLGYLHYPEAHTTWAQRYLQWSTAFNVRVAAQVIADSEATKRDLIQYCQAQPERIHVIYPGYDPTLRPAHDKARLDSVCGRYGIHTPYFVHVGTLQPRKNLVRLLEAFVAVVQEGQDVHLVLAGKKGWLYEPLFARVRDLRLEDRVHFTDYLPQDDLPVLLTGARAFVLPSLYEGFGFPILEAMACGTPVICSNVSSLPEVAGDAAMLVNPLDTGQLASAMHRLLHDDALAKDLAARGLTQASLFSWERCAQQVLALLCQVARTP